MERLKFIFMMSRSKYIKDVHTFLDIYIIKMSVLLKFNIFVDFRDFSSIFHKIEK